MTHRRYQKNRDKTAMELGWTHRHKRKSKDPYLKLAPHQTFYEGKPGATFIDMQQSFRYIEFTKVVELDVEE